MSHGKLLIKSNESFQTRPSQKNASQLLSTVRCICSHAPQFICDHKVGFVIFQTRFKITREHEEMGGNKSSKIWYSSTWRKIFFHLSQSVGVRTRLGSTIPNVHHVSSSVKSYLEVRKEQSLRFVISNFATWIPRTKYNYACNDFQKYKED